MNQKLLYILLFVTGLSPLVAQQLPSYPCADSSQIYATQIASIGDPLDLKIQRILDVWARLCDYSEPTERLQILIAIEKGVFQEQMLIDYLQEGEKRYISRTLESGAPDWNELYQANEAWFCYMPLHSPFDLYTKILAENLLTRIPKNTTEYLACSLFAGNISSYQKQRRHSRYKYTPLHAYLNERPAQISKRDALVYQTAAVGVLSAIGLNAAPLGNSLSMQYSLGFNRLKKARFVELYGGFDIFMRPDTIAINYAGGRFDFSPELQFQLGIRFGKRIARPRGQWLDYGLGGGFTTLSLTDPDLSNQVDQLSFDTQVTTMELTGSGEYAIPLRNSRALGLKASLHFRPYGFDRRLLSPVTNYHGALSLRYYW
jgi:hypothetical protein